jgi:hypothetical protein
MLERGPHHEPPFALSARAARPSLDISNSREVCSVEAPKQARDKAVDFAKDLQCLK